MLDNDTFSSCKKRKYENLKIEMSLNNTNEEELSWYGQMRKTNTFRLPYGFGNGSRIKC